MTTRAELLSAFEAFADALKACDTHALDRLMASDYRSYNLRGYLEERDVVLDAYAPGVTKLEEWETDELQVEIFPDVGIITGRGFLAGSSQGQPWSHHLRFVDVWVLRGERWRLLISQATPMEES
jgi:ketosteroid isomerase-like protein